MNTSNAFVNEFFFVLDLDDGSRLGYPIKNVRRIATSIDIANMLSILGFDKKTIAKVKSSENFKRGMERVTSFGAESASCLSLIEDTDIYLTKLEDYFFSIGYGGLTHYYFIGKTSDSIQKLRHT